MIHNFVVLEQPWDVGFWAGCGWLIPGSCQAPTGPLPQHHCQGIEGTRARKLQDKVGLRGEGKRKIQVKQRTWLSPSLIQLPSQPPNNLHLGCQTLFLLPKNPSFYGNSQNTGALSSFSHKSKAQHHTGCYKESQHHSSQTQYPDMLLN